MPKLIFLLLHTILRFASEVRVSVLTAINSPHTDLILTKKWHEGVILIILLREIKVYSYELTNKLNIYYILRTMLSLNT